jgi:hypothetical protein
MGLLIAPTLLDSFKWLKTCPPSWREKAYADIKGTLGREPFAPTPAIQAGIDFEKRVYQLANNPYRNEIKMSDKFAYVLTKVAGYKFGQSSQHTINVDGVAYFIKNRYDAIKEDHIVDIKTTGNFRGEDQFLSKWQSKFYPFFSQIPDMTFLVVEWQEPSKYVIGNVYEVPMHVHDFSLVEEEIKVGIREFIAYLDMDDTLSELYYTKYNMYGTNKYRKA